MSDAASERAEAQEPAAHERDFLPAGSAKGGPAVELVPLPWPGISKIDCLLWAIALHRAAVSVRLTDGGSQ